MPSNSERIPQRPWKSKSKQVLSILEKVRLLNCVNSILRNISLDLCLEAVPSSIQRRVNPFACVCVWVCVFKGVKSPFCTCVFCSMVFAFSHVFPPKLLLLLCFYFFFKFIYFFVHNNCYVRVLLLFF